MFCKICYDMHKSASEYTSHSVKNGDKVTCPVLLNIECLYCKNSGHTYSYCPNFRTPPKKISQKPPQKPIKPLQKPKKNIFSVLLDESSEDEELQGEQDSYEQDSDEEQQSEQQDNDVFDIPSLLRTTNSHEIKPKWKMGFSWADEMA